MGQTSPSPVALPVFRCFDMILTDKLKHLVGEIIHRKFVAITAHDAFKGAGLTGLDIPWVERAASVG